MNKQYYGFGNPFKVKFRKHYCIFCSRELEIKKHRKVVSQKSEEAKFYDFSLGVDGGNMIGPCEFIHKVFYCQNCNLNIEFVTQLSIEDIDIFINKIKQKYLKKGIDLEIKKSYIEKSGKIFDKVERLEDIQYLCLTVYQDNEKISMFKIPMMRKNCWERPYYFELSKTEIVKSIEKLIK